MIKSYFLSKVRSIRADQNRRIFVNGAVGSFLIKIAGAGLLFAVQVILARLCGAEQYGFYAYALSWLTILTIFAKLGFDTSLLRFIPEYLIKQDWGRARGIIRSSFMSTGIVSVVLALLGNLAIYFAGDLVRREWIAPLRIMLLVLPFYTVTGVRQAALRGFKNVVQAELPESVVRPIFLALCAVMFYNMMGQLDAATAWISQLVAVIVAFVLGTLLLVRRMRRTMAERATRFEHRLWFSASLPMLLISSMDVILNQASIIILGFFRPSEEIAIFSAAWRIVLLATFILMAINSIAAPMISELFHSGKQKELQILLGFSAKGIAVFTFVTTIFLVAFGRYFLQLFGQEFVQAYPLLLILLIGQTIKTLMGPASFLLNLTGHHNLIAKIMSIAVFVSLLLNFLLIPKLGALGAAIASSLTVILWNVTLVIFDRMVVKLDPSIFYLFRPKSDTR